MEYRLDIEIKVGSDPKVLKLRIPIIISTPVIEGLAVEEPDAADEKMQEPSSSKKDKNKEEKKKDRSPSVATRKDTAQKEENKQDAKPVNA